MTIGFSVICAGDGLMKYVLASLMQNFTIVKTARSVGLYVCELIFPNA